MQDFSSGEEALDSLLNGLRAGDNVVWVAPPDVPLAPFVTAFLGAGRPTTSLLYLALDDARTALQRLVASTDGSRQLAWCADLGPLPETPGLDLDPLDCGATAADLTAAVSSLSAFRRHESRLVIDSLTAVQHRYDRQQAVEFFLWACPLLYRRRSIAYWLVDASAHTADSLRRLREITQVVLAVRRRRGELTIEVEKADGRDPDVVGQVMHYGPQGTSRSHEPIDFADIGAALRRAREQRGLTLAEVGRTVGVSASALSQAERGVRGLSGTVLTRVWKALGVPYGPPASEEAERGHRVLRRSARRNRRLDAGLQLEPVIDDEGGVDASIVVLSAGSSGRGSPVPAKRRELIVVLNGVAELEIDSDVATLHEGDACVLTHSAVTAWSNPSAQETRLLWILLPGS